MMQQDTLLTRQDVLDLLPVDTRKREAESGTAIAYWFTNYRGNQAVLGFAENDKLPRLQAFDLTVEECAETVQQFLSQTNPTQH